MSDEQIEYFSELNKQSATRAAIRAERSALRRATAGFLILLAGLMLVLFMFGQAIRSNQHDADVSLRASQISSCERVNILRAQSNISDFVQFQVLSEGAQRESKLAEMDNPLTRKTHAESAARFADLAGNLTVTPITDCSMAVDHAQVYRIPVAGPIGNPLTGKLKPNVQAIRDSSYRVARRGGA